MHCRDGCGVMDAGILHEFFICSRPGDGLALYQISIH